MTITTAFAELNLAALTGSPKQIAWAEKIRATEMASLLERVAELINSFAVAIAEHPAEGKEMVDLITLFVTAQATKTEATYWINDIRTQGAPRQQLNHLGEKWAAELQKQIESRIAAEGPTPTVDMTIDEIIEAITVYSNTSLAYKGKYLSFEYVNAIEAVTEAYSHATDNLHILYLAKGVNPYKYHFASPAERLEAAKHLREYIAKNAEGVAA